MSPAKVSSRDPKIVKTLGSLVGPIWVLACMAFYGNGSVAFFPPGLSAHPNYTPFLIAFAVTLALLVVAYLVVRSQNAAGKSLEQLQSLSPDAFEDWVAARFRDAGYSTKVAGTQGDHGIDLVVEKNGETAIVQCKKFRSASVGEPVLRDLFGAMHDFGANKAYIVTTGRLTKSAAAWVQGKPIEIWDGARVAELSRRMAKRTASPTESVPQKQSVSTEPPPVPASHSVPNLAAAAGSLQMCPRCGATLLERRNRTTGERFLGCSAYPKCRYTHPGA